MIRALVVHEVRLIAEVTAAALRAEPDIAVVTCVNTTQETLSLLRGCPCDVLLVSITLPAEGAWRLTRVVVKSHPAVKILLTGIIDAKAVILPYFEEGVAGYVHIDDTLPALVEKIRAVWRDECLISPTIAVALIARLQELKQAVQELNGLQAMNPATLYATLTAREEDVLSLIEQEYSNLEIADTLCLELGTVKNHVHNLLNKLGVPTRKQAARIARQALAAGVTPVTTQFEAAGLPQPACPVDRDRQWLALPRFASA
jgi:two-component system nitrate/nitrite response regulator NarL